ncbi:hypothetical protein F5144DRAFT_244329 [Chaetomium tenue]|uniref:Uncharacterized protein n=1 Tax=Chaetomium tenue TaxID=1854479 RepID=A0ACB7PAL6_9PEZI|nr:hypothetical protein F5144DRAFT_244329 [Chaetomium globosum]
MQLTLSSTLVFLGLLGISSAAPAGQDIDPVTFGTALPSTCVGWGTKPTCYTATTTTTAVPTICPMIKCVAPTDPIMCPMVIKVTTVSVPCSTDCCPRTPTATVTEKGRCPGCTTGCVIPTHTVTVTTGCKTTGIIRPTAILTVA